MTPKKFAVTSTDFSDTDDRWTTMEEKIKKIVEVQNDIKQSQEKIELTQHKILAILGKLTNDDFPLDDAFPLLNTDALINWENKIQSDPSRYIKTLRSIIKGDVVKNFDAVVGKTIIEEYNYDGVQDKKCFKQYTALNDAIYNALKVDGLNERLYKQTIRYAFKIQKGRLAKRKYDSKTKQLQNKENVNSAENEGDTQTNDPLVIKKV